MPYRIDYQPGATRAVERLERAVARRVIARIGLLADDPRPRGSLKLQGEDAYRIRVGDYRIIYTIEDDRLLVLIVDVGHRGDVYRRR